MTQKRLSENAQISRSTLQQIENGCPNVAIGNYAKVLEVMGLQNHFSRVALNDVAWASSVMQEVRRKRYRFSDKQE